MSDSRDQRDFTRVHADLAVEVTVGDQHVANCHLEDLSMSGASLSVKGRLPDGVSCEVAITLLGAEPPVRIIAKGAISRSQENRIAVEFSEMDDESFVHLQKLVLFNAEDPAQVENELDTSVGIKRQSTDF